MRIRRQTRRKQVERMLRDIAWTSQLGRDVAAVVRWQSRAASVPAWVELLERTPAAFPPLERLGARGRARRNLLDAVLNLPTEIRAALLLAYDTRHDAAGVTRTQSTRTDCNEGLLAAGLRLLAERLDNACGGT